MAAAKGNPGKKGGEMRSSKRTGNPTPEAAADEPLICMFCGNANRVTDDGFTRVTKQGVTVGWHPDCWPTTARNLSDIVCHQTAEGIRGRVRIAPIAQCCINRTHVDRTAPPLRFDD